MQVEWFRSFTEAAKWKSLSKAADRLSLTQPAISKQIRQLEATYGIELFRRSAAGVDLTEAGRHFLERIMPVVASLDTIEAGMRRFKAEPGYTLGCLPSVVTRLHPGRLRDYRDAGHPVTIKVRQTSAALRDELQEGAFDAALLDAAFAGDRMWSKTLFTEGYVAVLPEDHPFRGRTSLRLEELRKERFVFASPQCEIHDRVKTLAESYGYSPDVELEVDGNKEFLFNVAVGAGITVLPEMLAAEAKQMNLQAVPLAEPGLRRTVALAARTADVGAKLFRLLDAEPVPSA
ncbi:DNA-binding transcriptional regulator, LysR family [Paenibacillus sp. UNC496MF]|uniref:LysR family transcriptional regulator n=1 Tax=Paenibacillus sp. UNC496MF TaxID=1502753 RepID=UPI0008F21A3C|nr:LysR family transcriptional regulator [Paenibacillus sp. UNC496MF]SFJ83640.1 DNA-binding transcriptional regulator, LysR family [Paenibacillus sp. UNC496MF]